MRRLLLLLLVGTCTAAPGLRGSGSVRCDEGDTDMYTRAASNISHASISAWHIPRSRPTGYGFDIIFGGTGGGGNNLRLTTDTGATAYYDRRYTMRHQSGAVAMAASTTTMAEDEWSHGSASAIASNDHRAWHNAGSEGTSSTSIGGSMSDEYICGKDEGEWLNGELGHLGMWDCATPLDQDDMIGLEAGWAPRFMKLECLEVYAAFQNGGGSPLVLYKNLEGTDFTCTNCGAGTDSGPPVVNLQQIP